MPVLGLLIVVAIIAFLFMGGGDEPSMVERGDQVKTTVNTDILIIPWRKAIQAYEAVNGELPDSLDDLDDQPPVPDGYDIVYDPADGDVRFVED